MRFDTWCTYPPYREECLCPLSWCCMSIRCACSNICIDDDVVCCTRRIWAILITFGITCSGHKRDEVLHQLCLLCVKHDHSNDIRVIALILYCGSSNSQRDGPYYSLHYCICLEVCRNPPDVLSLSQELVIDFVFMYCVQHAICGRFDSPFAHTMYPTYPVSI